MVGPTQRGSNLRMWQGIQAHRPPSHISKTVLSTVHVGGRTLTAWSWTSSARQAYRPLSGGVRVVDGFIQWIVVIVGVIELLGFGQVQGVLLISGAQSGANQGILKYPVPTGEFLSHSLANEGEHLRTTLHEALVEGVLRQPLGVQPMSV